jgi:hypothetical protein
MTRQTQSPIYQIKIQGKLDPAWLTWLNGLTLTQESDEPGNTILSGPIVDQARLRGILNNLWDLNLTILAVNRLR